jgi:hypothetical protein
MRLYLVRSIDRSRSLSGTDELIYTDRARNEVREISHLHVYRDNALTGDLSGELQQIQLNSLHLIGKEFFLLTSKTLGCETIGWRPV